MCVQKEKGDIVGRWWMRQEREVLLSCLSLSVCLSVLVLSRCPVLLQMQLLQQAGSSIK